MFFGSARRRRRFAAALLLLFAAVAVTGPLLHHDFACHFKSPTHCSGCGVSLAIALSGVGLPPAVVPDETGESLPREPEAGPRNQVGLRNPGRGPPPSA